MQLIQSSGNKKKSSQKRQINLELLELFKKVGRKSFKYIHSGMLD